MNRRGFLARLTLAGAGLVVGDAALETFARLTHRRRLWPGADFRIRTVRGGLWSDPATWGGVLPRDGDVVELAHPVTLNSRVAHMLVHRAGDGRMRIAPGAHVEYVTFVGDAGWPSVYA